SQTETEARISAEPAGVELSTAVALYHIAHECLSNIQRHAQASHVTLSLTFAEADGVLEVADDGAGFDPAVAVSEEHRGLRNIAARVRSFQGKLKVESAKGAGSRIAVEFPL